MSKPEVKQAGRGWLFLWHDHGIGIGFDQLVENSHGIYGEITVAALTNGSLDGHIHWAKLRLDDTRGRSEIAKYLHGRDDAVNWPELIEQACTLTARQHREGVATIDLAKLQPPEQRAFLVDKLLPLGDTTLLYANGESGKSLFCLAIATVCRLGLSLPGGLTAQQQVGVLYCDWETNAVAHARRLRRIAAGFGVQPPTIHYRRMWRPLAQDIDRLAKDVDRLGIGLLVVDSAGYAAQGDIKDAEAATNVYNALHSLNLTTLLIHHVSAEGARTVGATNPYGTIFWRNGARNAWEIRSSQNETGSLNYSLWHRKDNDGKKMGQPIGIAALFTDPIGPIVFRTHLVTDDPELAQHGGLAYQLRAALREGPATAKELAEEIGSTSEKTVASTLHRMSDVVKLDPGGRGRGNATRWGLASLPF